MPVVVVSTSFSTEKMEGTAAARKEDGEQVFDGLRIKEIN